MVTGLQHRENQCSGSAADDYENNIGSGSQSDKEARFEK